MKSFLAVLLSLIIITITLSKVDNSLHEILCDSNSQQSKNYSVKNCSDDHNGPCSSKSSNSTNNQKKDCNPFSCSVNLFSNVSLDYITNFDLSFIPSSFYTFYSKHLDRILAKDLSSLTYVRGPPLVSKA